MSVNDKNIRLVAIYLPQFHPIPENDRWWGTGFTEWTNVVQSRPLFRGHYQPHLPSELGYYDLRVPEVQEAQAQLALEHGISGFCYYHYWFNGARLLHRPFGQVLRSGRPDFPFCLCWANESWSRRWLGEDRDILIAQEYSLADDREHARWLTEAFGDPRYLKTRGDRAIFLIYRPKDLPEPRATTDIIRKATMHAGLPEPWLVGVDAHCRGADLTQCGFDAILQFRPQLAVHRPSYLQDNPSVRRFYRNLKRGVVSSVLKIYDDAYSRRVMRMLKKPTSAYPSCYVGWDNSPRRGTRGIMFINGSPAQFEEDLRAACTEANALPADDRLVFINAWNEWAEGNHLEPDQRYGRAYLEAVKRVASNGADVEIPSAR